jgi:hypothetical protein
MVRNHRFGRHELRVIASAGLAMASPVFLEVQPSPLSRGELDSERGERSAQLGGRLRSDDGARRERQVQHVGERDCSRSDAAVTGELSRPREAGEVVVAVPAADELRVGAILGVGAREEASAVPSASRDTGRSTPEISP